MKKSYTAPAVKVVGSLAELTLREKELGVPNDGDFFNHKSLKTVS